MITPVLRFVDDATGVGIEAPLSSATLAELRDAFAALVNGARFNGLLSDCPPPDDPVTDVLRVEITRS